MLVRRQRTLFHCSTRLRTRFGAEAPLAGQQYALPYLLQTPLRHSASNSILETIFSVMASPVPSVSAEQDSGSPSTTSTPPIDLDDDGSKDEAQGRSDFVNKIKQRSQTHSESSTPRKNKVDRPRTSSPKAEPSSQKKGESKNQHASLEMTQPYQTDTESAESEGESSEGPEYEVERILSHRTDEVSEKGEVCQYFIKWKGYPASANSWEPEVNLNADKILKKYWDEWDRKHPKAKVKVEPGPSKGAPGKAASTFPKKRERPNGAKKDTHKGKEKAVVPLRKKSARLLEAKQEEISSDELQTLSPPPKRKVVRSQHPAPHKPKRQLFLTKSASPSGKVARPCRSNNTKADISSSDDDSDEYDSDSASKDSDRRHQRVSQKSSRGTPSRKANGSSATVATSRRSHSEHDEESGVNEQLSNPARMRKIYWYLAMESWDDKLDEILEVKLAESPPHVKKAHLRFKSGDQVWMRVQDVYERAPQQMLMYYDTHVKC